MRPRLTEHAERRGRIARALPEARFDALLVSALPNVRYLAGFTGSNALLLQWEDDAVLFTDPRYTVQARRQAGCRVEVARGSLYSAAAKLMARKRWRRIGFEAARMTYAAYAELDGALPASVALRPAPAWIDRQRMVKSASEVARIRTAVQTNSEAFRRAVSRIRSSTSENELAAELEYQMRKLGAEKAAFDSIVASGAHSALPHAQPRDRPLEPNRLVLVDVGCVQDGYMSDMTRMLHIGRPQTKARKLHRAVLDAQLAAIDAVRPGVTAAAVDRAARRALRDHGLDKLFIHSTGHGLGLEIHEAPRVGRKEKTRLEAGMVITIEPGAYDESFGGVRIEDTVLVTETGCEVLTPTPKELLVI
ncbi:MAG: aminopeptidase P family protein [Acidobacteria bacterium]|nr:aminopeptidase P family protein [Acidobacteriota bacterium]MBI3280231.1 aminopeptidase P family protein [Acidobacteriota bacterium]